MLVKADDGHPGSVMSLVEIICDVVPTLDLKKDKLIISKGHGGMILYPILHEHGFISHEDIRDFRTPGALLTMFPNKSIPGIAVSCGSLGCGLGYGCGFALANRSNKVVVIVSEGELYEGSTWEALMFARHYKLENLRVIVDKNDAITLGKPSECLDIPWDVLNSFPFVEVIQTVKGKGVPAWEGKIESHYWSRPNA
jgi:transketolase N-terminal domain/subunit